MPLGLSDDSKETQKFQKNSHAPRNLSHFDASYKCNDFIRLFKLYCEKEKFVKNCYERESLPRNGKVLLFDPVSKVVNFILADLKHSEKT